MPRVIVSSGHTAQNPGTIANGLREYDVAKAIAKAVIPVLRQNGVQCLVVPPNLDLFKRIEWINQSGFDQSTNDVAIEVHINDDGRSGIEVWHEGKGPSNSQKLAEEILTATVNETGLSNLGNKSEYDHELGSISFIHEVQPISCIIECGFIDNANDAAFLKQDANLQKAGSGIAKGILRYYNMPVAQSSIPQPISNPAVNTNANLPVNNSLQNTFSRPGIATTKPMQPVRPMPTSLPSDNMMSPLTNAGGLDDDFAFDEGLGDDLPAIPQFNRTPIGTNPQAFNPSAGGLPARPGVGGAPAPMLSRDERKEVIKKTYVKILGREPNQNDLNYFLNIGIKEDELIKKMMDSQEHADLVKARQEVISIKQKSIEEQNELIALRAFKTDNEKIIANLTQSLNQKNIALQQMQHKLNSLTYTQKMMQQSPTSNSTSSKKYKGTFLDKLFKAFSDLFE